MKPCAGDWVEILSKNEILATLDSNGRLEGLPFMPQMLKFCGRRFQVHKRAQNGPAGETRYVCQATELWNYSMPMKNWDARQYVEDYRSGNASLNQVSSVLFFAAFQKIARAPRLGRPARWLYDSIQSLRGGTPYPRKPGTLRPGAVSPAVDIGLKPGELVRVKSLDQILATVGPQNMHRGMSFDVEM